MPLWILLLTAGLIIANVLTVTGSWANTSMFGDLPLSYPPALRQIAALVWIGMFALLLFGLLRKSRRAYAAAAPLISLYAAFGLLWLVVFAQADYDRRRVGFQALLSLVLLLPLWWVALRNGYVFRRRG